MISKGKHYTFKIFEPFKNLVAAFSSKEIGNMSFNRGGEEETVLSRKSFFKELNISQENVVMMGMVHGSRVEKVYRKERVLGSLSKECEIRKTDGFLSGDPGIFLMTTACDCLPVLFYDKKRNIVGLVHAGFSGTRKKITENMIKKFVQYFKTSPRDLLVVFGPSIKKCCLNKKRKKDLDLVYWNLKQLKGVSSNNVEISNICTKCDLSFSSHRREGSMSQAHGAIIGMRNER